ncbi:MAG: hypothetical protein HQL06_10870 [Nitrospirae bacterium]|nr:hypothetical protein [Nitrospirota bacterium]
MYLIISKCSIVIWLISTLAVVSIDCLFIAEPVAAQPRLMDRVVAFVDETAITLSEFNKVYKKAQKAAPGVSEEEVIRGMINRLLLKKEALKLRLSVKDDELINQYIDLRIKSFVIIKNEDIERYYNENKNNGFKGIELEDARDSIERLLIEIEVNRRLDSSLMELWKKAYIKIQLE